MPASVVHHQDQQTFVCWVEPRFEQRQSGTEGRHMVQCNINLFKDFRALATRYEKRGHQFLAAVHVAYIILWL